MHNAFMVPISLFGCLIFTDNWSTYVDTVIKKHIQLKRTVFSNGYDLLLFNWKAS